MEYGLHILFVLISVAVITHSYPNGAPEIACSSLDPSPGHGPSSNQGPAPYDVTFSDSEYTPGRPIELTLSGENGETFEGFLLKAYPSPEISTDAVGTFAAPGNAPYKTACISKTGSGVTHTDKSKKSNVTLQWVAPADSNENMVFHYTVVRGKTGPSDYFKSLRTKPLAARTVKPMTEFQKDPDCGKTKGCLGNCKADNSCDWLITWQQEGPSDVRLSLVSIVPSDNKYVALGFSEQAKMFKASVVSCRVHDGNVDVVGSTNPGYANQPLDNPTEGLSDIHGSYTNGLLNCSFLREMTSSNVNVYNLTDPWYLITAKGDVNEDGSLAYHGSTDRHFTASKVKVPNSVDMSFGGDSTTTTTPAQTTQSTTPAKDLRFKKDPACGKTKGCYSNCDSDGTCDWLISWWKQNDETAAIELKSSFSSDNKYVAMGFSKRPGMFDASVLSCRLQKGQVDAVASFNMGYSNTALQNATVTLSRGSFASGVLSCTIMRKMESDDPKVFNLTQPWYLITARGDVDNSGVLQQHDSTNRFVTNFQVDVMSSVMDIPFVGGPASTTPAAPAKTFPKDPACGKSKGCFSNCDDGECDFLMSWKKSGGDDYEISLQSGFDSDDDHYVALGFSKADKMSGLDSDDDNYVALGFSKAEMVVQSQQKRTSQVEFVKIQSTYPASVAECMVSGGHVSASLSYNSGYQNKKLPPAVQTIVKQIRSSFKDGVLSCTFTRPIKSNDSRVFDLDDDFYLITARGNAPGGIMAQHSAQNRFLTSSQVAMADPSVDISMEESEYPLIKAHGCLMVLAWILSASIGIAMARFFKPVWPDTKICGVKVWFAIHRSAMVLTFCLGLAAFIIIFVQVEGYSEIVGEDYKKAHPILGIIVTALLVINPFMSLLRCGPDHPQRPLFNWAHFIVGSSAHILAAVTIALGLYLPKAQADGDTGLIVLIVYGSWQVLFFCVMTALDFIAKHDSKIPAAALHQHIQMTSKKQSFSLENDYSSMSNINPTTESNEGLRKEEVKMATAKQWVLAFHVIVLVAVAAYLMSLIIDTDV